MHYCFWCWIKETYFFQVACSTIPFSIEPNDYARVNMRNLSPYPSIWTAAICELEDDAGASVLHAHTKQKENHQQNASWLTRAVGRTSGFNQALTFNLARTVHDAKLNLSFMTNKTLPRMLIAPATCRIFRTNLLLRLFVKPDKVITGAT